MIDHTGIFVADPAKATAFYDAALGALGSTLLTTVPPEYTGGKLVVGYGQQHPGFWLTESGEAGPGRHYAFTAASRAAVGAFYKAALAAGGRDNGAPGIRAHYHPNYYAAFVIDPDGNNIEAVCQTPE